MQIDPMKRWTSDLPGLSGRQQFYAAPVRRRLPSRVSHAKPFRNSLKDTKRPGCLPFGKQVYMKLEMITALERLVDQALTNEYARGEEHSFQSSNGCQKRKRKFI